MSRDLYFLRSSEQKIIETLVSIAHPEAEEDLEKYTKFYGLTTKDLGLYALVDKKVAGAIWSRESVMSVAVVPEFKGTGIGSYMMEQFLLEAATMHSELSIDITHKAKSLKFYEKFGFKIQEDSSSLILIKKLQIKEIIRPTDGYDPTRWMD